MNATKKAYFELHLAVFLWGFTAILGELIQLSAVVLVWWRVLLTSISLMFIIRTGKLLRELPRKNIVQFALAGVLTGLHWLTFYGAIKLANASLALLCMATWAFFKALIEPFFLKQKIKWCEIFLGFLIIPGMVMVVENVDLSMHLGIWVGLVSSLLAALFSILNKKWIDDADPLSITFIEMSSAWLFLCLALPIFFHMEPGAALLPSGRDFLLLIVLSLLCTTFTWVLALRSLKHMSAFAATLTVNMEPVYGILLAILILKEHRELPSGFYWGVALILVVVFFYPLANRLMKKRTDPV